MTTQIIDVSFPQGARGVATGKLAVGMKRLAIRPGALRARGVGIDTNDYNINGVDVDFVLSDNGKSYLAPLTADQESQVRSFSSSVKKAQEPPPPPADPPPPPEPLGPFPSKVPLTSTLTPFEDAYRIWSEEMRPHYWAIVDRERPAFSSEEASMYYLFRGKRNALANHNGEHGVVNLHSDLEQSIEDAGEWLVEWEAFMSWYDSQAMTEEKYAAYIGVDRLGADTLKTAHDKALAAAREATADISPKTGAYATTWREAAATAREEADVVYVQVGQGTTSARDGFNSARSVYNSFRKEVAAKVAAVKSRLALFDDPGAVDNPLSVIIDDIVQAGVETGLTPHDTWNSRDDGHVWFTDANDEAYFFALGGLYQVLGSAPGGGLRRVPYDAMEPVIAKTYGNNNPVSHADLIHYTSRDVNTFVASDAGRVFQDRGSLIKSIKWNFETLADESYPGRKNPFAA